MQKFEAYPSRVKIAGLMCINLALLAACAHCVMRSDVRALVAGWLGIPFFGFTLFACLRMWMQAARPKIVMDERGIHTGSAVGLVEWVDIVAFRVNSISRNKILSIDVDDPQKYLNRISYLARKNAELSPRLGLSEITISFAGLTPGLDEACRYLFERGSRIENFGDPTSNAGERASSRMT